MNVCVLFNIYYIHAENKYLNPKANFGQSYGKKIRWHPHPPLTYSLPTQQWHTENKK